jgi:hypothetical protein
MNTFMLLKHSEKRIVVAQYFKSEDEAIHWWARMPISNEWEIIYMEERKPSGHRYELTYTKYDEQGVLYSKYIICFSKKEALYLKDKIEKVNQHYIIQIEKLY